MRTRGVVLVVFLALAAFRRRPRFTELPSDVRLDVKAFFHSYKEACAAADALLFQLADQNAIDEYLKKHTIEFESGKATLTPAGRTILDELLGLLRKQKEHKMVGVLQELMRKEDNSYVRFRCQRALHEMNASVETY